ncbi:AIG2-like family protein [Aspergillus parasiticus SU-1]|uniref:Putative gamma-glutamylcyclotransferase n=1 Tax=Aspergillus parasiticus (strain ATCC 56775 / NRRL 5862 / SRRC 143 / SU-1) TaxID=1403190 RepID=A0A0F0IN64_ASPPU|nr:AIG2-like family protein [Aspergillus parasiticus SU-1]
MTISQNPFLVFTFQPHSLPEHQNFIKEPLFYSLATSHFEMDLLTELENLAVEAQNENKDTNLETAQINNHIPTTQLKPQKRDYTTTYLLKLEDKHLSNYSMLPYLGADIDPTLPHHRAQSMDQIFLPAQNQYPVWYFFYGTLTDPEILARKLSLPGLPVLRRAMVKGGRIIMWGGKYNALIDGPSSSIVDGWAYEVRSEEEEEQLRYYETDQYEVVY